MPSRPTGSPRLAGQRRFEAETHRTKTCPPGDNDIYPKGLRQADELAFAAERFISIELTADFVYIRLHGNVELYRSGYSSEAIAQWARRVKAFSKHGDVYVYFDNDVKAHAPFDANALVNALRGP